MRGSRQTVAASAFALALLVPAIPLAAQESPDTAPPAGSPASMTPSNVSPVAAVTARQSGGTVTFDASRSADPDGRIVDYQWDLDGDSIYETDTVGKPTVDHRYPAGTALVAAVRVTDDSGATDDATATAAVSDRPRSAAPALVRTPELATAATPDEQPPVPAPKSEPTVRAAASGSVTIKDFSFGPSSVTVGVGDTVTWTNSGPSIHTATANDGSFDSGNLDKGKSYSKTFSSAGTYSYICRPHPFMTGKIVVTAAGAGGGGSNSGSGSGNGSSNSGSGSGSSGGSNSGTGSGSGSGSTSGLARTGVDLIPWSLFGFSLFAFGAAMRFRLRAE